MWYFVIGFLMLFVVRTYGGRFAITDPVLAFITFFFWPLLLIYVAFKVERLVWQGKVIWERKKK